MFLVEGRKVRFNGSFGLLSCIGAVVVFSQGGRGLLGSSSVTFKHSLLKILSFGGGRKTIIL